MKRYKSVENFANVMQAKLNQNSYKGGWRKEKCDLGFLLNKLTEEWREWVKSGETDSSELIDIANICMMLYSRRKELDGMYLTNIVEKGRHGEGK